MNRQGELSEPLHAQVAEWVRARVRAGTYPPGDRLPPEPDLARAFGVSRGTLRHALRVLADEGLIRSLPGRGTFVGDGLERPRGETDGAPGVASGATLVGLVMPSIVRARNPELIAGVEEVLREGGYSLVLGISGDDRALEGEQIQRIVAQGASGLILYLVDGPLDGLDAVRRLVAAGLPLVLIDRFIPDLQVDAVSMDNLGGAFLAVQHLARACGRRRIGYVGTDNVGTSSIVERMAGYRWAMQACGLAVDEDLVCTALRRLLSWPVRERDQAAARHNQEVLRRYLAGRSHPDAVYICNDYVAFQVVEAAESLGLRIPEDLALVGFDNVAYHEYFGVPLTSVEQPRHEIGTTAASLLLERLRGRRQRVERIAVASRLVVRQSSGATPGPYAEPAPRVALAAVG